MKDKLAKLKDAVLSKQAALMASMFGLGCMVPSSSMVAGVSILVAVVLAARQLYLFMNNDD